MPQAIVPAIIGGATQLGGALLGAHGASNAAKAQERAGQRAMDYQRSRDAEMQRRYDAQQADYQRRLAAYEANKRAVLERFGVKYPEAAAGAPAGAPGPAAASPGMAQGGPAGAPSRLSLADITQRPGGRVAPEPIVPSPGPEMPEPGAAMSAPPPARGGSLAELSDPTYSWRRYAAQ